MTNKIPREYTTESGPNWICPYCENAHHIADLAAFTGSEEVVVCCPGCGEKSFVSIMGLCAIPIHGKNELYDGKTKEPLEYY
ncbi:hypothetical protein LJC32_01985 [Oscillospiraceae bacterium OttesenSCG-928-F05]|nr:hypothetical protein [Oscillospiraceae bacterium OttesenSCG-928-F05]